MGEVFVQFIPFILIFAVFYFLLILPQQRHRKKMQEMLDNLKTGDRVLTNGGLYGTIVGFRDVQVVQLQVAPQVKVDVARSAIAALAQETEGKPQEASGGGKK
jgi:preprotein translocase subunit YajC